ncbi:MAG: ATP-dependent DNA helicase [Pseudomonadota bacterium]
MPELRVSVRELADFCHRRGDIDYRFTPSPSAAEGIAGHQRVQRSRGEGYIAEYPLEARLRDTSLDLHVVGRADGYHPDEALLEEIKTCRVPRDTVPASVESLHWAQLMLYGGVLCAGSTQEEVTLRLTYFHVDSEEEWQRQERCGRDQLLSFLEQTITTMREWLLLQQEWQSRRNASLGSLAWPFPSFRDTQRRMAETVYKCIATGGRALLEAPTGTGKTAASLFPALKAMGAGKHERVVFATARTVGRSAAEEGLRQLEANGLVLRRLSLTAKDSICFSPGKACQAEDCIYAAGYYDRLPDALQAAMTKTDLSRSAIEALARDYRVCPYQLAMDVLPWADMCIGDLHYVYSLNPAVAARYQELGVSWSLLVDEAHNLPDRARDMYSAVLKKASLLAARRQATGRIRTALTALNKLFLALDKAVWDTSEFDSKTTVPAALAQLLNRFTGAVSEALAQSPVVLQTKPDLLQFFFDCLQFQRVLEHWGGEFRFELQRDGTRQSMLLRLRCLDPARLLSSRHAAAQAVAAFSATASPPQWMLAQMGMPQAVYQSLPSPFDAGQLEVVLLTQIDIRYRARGKTLQDVSHSIVDWLAANPGNCIVYFSAYKYMNDVIAYAQPMIHGREVLCQQRHWGDEARQNLLQTFEQKRSVVAFCILGGVFGEGVDLPGDSLKSVVIVGAGLPQFNPERDALKHYYQSSQGRGFEFAYLYPGLQKVSQALGRVVRSEADQGRALIIDSRFGEPAYRALLPPWWSYRVA